ncbi:IS3 family transposase [Paracoccus sp. YIM 132242]|uniref:IS3 family transposase n=1 Tax=Paracoccus lichenicola TaxID=2665644 RepID=A0A6L6HSI3_9RHOB|nr:IS3 family transposase [Paracoccus lichenicola]
MTLPRSTYHYRLTGKHGTLTDAELAAIIEDIQDELPCYGYRRVTHELRRRGLGINHKKVARVMREAGLGIKPRRRFVRTTDSRQDGPIFPNLYRNIIPDRPDQVSVADFTYIRVATDLCYLAIILDACSRKVIDHALSRHLDTELALAAVHAAVMSRNPPRGCIHHADRGCQYASRDVLEAAGLRGSMSSAGNAYHNANAESFMKTLKVEEVYRAGYETFADVAARLPMFIKQLYNAKRLHSALGYRTPEEFDTLFAQKAAWFRWRNVVQPKGFISGSVLSGNLTILLREVPVMCKIRPHEGLNPVSLWQCIRLASCARICL